MSRKVLDCRDFPGDTQCTLTGQESEVLQAGAEHAVSTHGHVDGADLRHRLLEMMKDEVTASV